MPSSHRYSGQIGTRVPLTTVSEVVFKSQAVQMKGGPWHLRCLDATSSHQTLTEWGLLSNMSTLRRLSRKISSGIWP